MNDSTSPPLANSPEARSPTGEILDQASTTTPTPETTPSTPSTPDASATTPESAKPDATAVPESYTFKAPEGAEVDPALVSDATPIFKELGLSQVQVDKLMSLYTKHATIEGDKAKAIIAAQGKTWSDQVMADPELGPNIDKIKVNIGRALDALNNPKAVSAFREAMDFTMAGNNPAFIRVFNLMAERLTEGQHVSGTGPVASDAKGALTANQRPSLAQAMYPNLKAS